MTLMLPIVIAVVVAAVALGLWVAETYARAQRPPASRPHVDRNTEMWAQEVRRRLPEAFDALQVTKAGYLQQGKRPRPKFVGAGKPAPVGVGWQWTLTLPGSSLATDWDSTRLVAAINDASELGTIAEMHAPIPGRAQLTIWRRDPLDMVQPVPWRPGEQPLCCKPGQVCMGPQRNGQHVHFDAYGENGAYASKFVGRRGSGKSEAMRLWLAQVLAWDHVDPIIIDLVRAGVDYGVFEPLLRTEIITNPDGPRAFGHTKLVGGMKPVQLDKEPLADLVEYLYSLGGARDADPARVQRGAGLFEDRNCDLCHERDGKTAGQGPGLGGYLSVEWTRALLTDPASPLYYGSKNDMPAFGKKLTAPELDSLAVFLQAQRQTN